MKLYELNGCVIVHENGEYYVGSVEDGQPLSYTMDAIGECIQWLYDHDIADVDDPGFQRLVKHYNYDLIIED